LSAARYAKIRKRREQFIKVPMWWIEVAVPWLLLRTGMENELPIDEPDYWRRGAEETRILSEQMRDNQTKGLMLEIADTYERIAKAYDQPVGIKDRSA
jgi:hypothetical protein